MNYDYVGQNGNFWTIEEQFLKEVSSPSLLLRLPLLPASHPDLQGVIKQTLINDSNMTYATTIVISTGIENTVEAYATETSKLIS